MGLKRVPSSLVEGGLPILVPPSIIYSVVIPLYNDVATLPLLHQRVSAVMQDLGQPYEIVYVDDGSQMAPLMFFWRSTNRTQLTYVPSS